MNADKQANIRLILYSILRDYYPLNQQLFAIQSGISVADLRALLNIPEKIAISVIVDDRPGSLSTILRGGEKVEVFPMIGGG